MTQYDSIATNSPSLTQRMSDREVLVSDSQTGSELTTFKEGIMLLSCAFSSMPGTICIRNIKSMRSLHLLGQTSIHFTLILKTHPSPCCIPALLLCLDIEGNEEEQCAYEHRNRGLSGKLYVIWPRWRTLAYDGRDVL